MSDIVADIRGHLQAMAPHQRARLTAEQLKKAADEIERLRSLTRFQDRVIRSGDTACLTQAEETALDRVAIAYELLPTDGAKHVSETIRGLRERMTPREGERGNYKAESNTEVRQPTPQPDWMELPYWVDPPSGWRYGFPKLYDPAKDGPMREWLVKSGYPKALADKNLACTFTATEEAT